jgi:hypothetical protein
MVSGCNPRALPVRASAAAALLLALATLPAAGSEPPKSDGTSPIHKDPWGDMLLATKVRNVLKREPRFASLCRFVTVKDRVVFLEGEVANEDDLRDAAKRVEKVLGVAEVRTGLVKFAVPKNDMTLTIPLLPEQPSRVETHSSPDQAGSVNPHPAMLPRLTEPVPEIVSVRLEPPVPLPPIVRTEQVLTMRTTSLTDDVVSAVVERARQGNPRFRSLDVEIRGEQIWVRGTTDQIDVGMDFARALTDLGVRYIVIQCNLRAGR